MFGPLQVAPVSLRGDEHPKGGTAVRGGLAMVHTAVVIGLYMGMVLAPCVVAFRALPDLLGEED